MLVRWLGLQALSGLAASLPPTAARRATLAVLLLANATPLVALANGTWQGGDVLIAYWLENIAVGAWTFVRILTAAGPDPVGQRHGSGRGLLESGQVTTLPDGTQVQFPLVVARVFVAGSFTVHYGMFTLVHGVLTLRLADRIGTRGDLADYLLVLLALVMSHGLSTAVHWFGRGGRQDTGMMTASRQPYARVVLLHLVVLGSGFLLVQLVGPDALDGRGPVTGAAALLPAVLLVLFKTVLDGVLHLSAHRAETEPRQASPAALR